MEQVIGSRLRKEHNSTFCCHPVCLNLDEEQIMRNAGLDELQAGIKIGGKNINNLRYADDTILTAESEKTLDDGEGGE